MGHAAFGDSTKNVLHGDAIGILDFYHAVQHLWQAVTAYSDGNFAPAKERLECGFDGCVINYGMDLVNVSSRN
ncbi:MAG: hypothetical protein CLLPBCKN_001630 [Chroococcidiopsis cubana SAG 39.79]|uniref:Uncharacterized protein n=1 Tax=Chroococcidiopsis cubana SAG 39.79 TaxID=388085 RepID=A0AB37UEN6_9CYAN|nr:hypothetical protein [Chroococcidiopsis cubana SAG 39.79]RUT07389.1 hypothetical protein DSM107010_50680 [Chroococcidiopsis cubana SAG 39.79]